MPPFFPSTFASSLRPQQASAGPTRGAPMVTQTSRWPTIMGWIMIALLGLSTLSSSNAVREALFPTADEAREEAKLALEIGQSPLTLVDRLGWAASALVSVVFGTVGIIAFAALVQRRAAGPSLIVAWAWTSLVLGLLILALQWSTMPEFREQILNPYMGKNPETMSPSTRSFALALYTVHITSLLAGAAIYIGGCAFFIWWFARGTIRAEIEGWRA